MTDKVTALYPSNDFKAVADAAKDDIECGIIIGYDADGALSIYGGGMLDGRQPTQKDWLWMVETFKQDIVSGVYAV